MLKLKADPRRLRVAYGEAQPFPHAVIDGLFEEAALEAALEEFPSAEAPHMQRFDSATENKLGFDYRTPIGDRLRSFLNFLNSATMLVFLEELTGIEGLISDPYFGGAGPHEIPPGGFLKVHADFNWHSKLRLDRRLNLLIYCNRDWKEEYGGHLELWDREMSGWEQRILPVFNRTVIFNTTDTSFHGHPEPLRCPAHRSRRSISMYYYTNGRPDEERSAPHDTIFKKTHEEDW